MPSHKESGGISIGEILEQDSEITKKLQEIEESPEARQNALEVARKQAIEKINASKIEEARVAVNEIILSDDEDDNKLKNSSIFKELVSKIGELSLTRKAISEATDIDLVNALSEKEISSIDSLNTLYEKLGEEYSQKYEEEQKTTETEPPAQTQEPIKDRKPIFVKGTRNEELAQKIESESNEALKEKQQEQISLAAERLADQKSKLQDILAKPDLSPDKKGLIGRAIKESEQLFEKASELKEKGGVVNQNEVERLWARIEKNFDIISAGINEITIPPEDLPVVPTELEPAKKMDNDLGEKEPKIISPEKGEIIEESMRVYLNTLATGGSEKEAKNESQNRFLELNPEGTPERSQVFRELTGKWEEDHKERLEKMYQEALDTFDKVLEETNSIGSADNTSYEKLQELQAKFKDPDERDSMDLRAITHRVAKEIKARKENYKATGEKKPQTSSAELNPDEIDALSGLGEDEKSKHIIEEDEMAIFGLDKDGLVKDKKPDSPASAEKGKSELDSFKVETIEDTEAEKILSKAEIHGDEFRGKTLTPEILKNEGLLPRHKITIGDSVVWFSSSGYELGGGRIAVVAYVEKDEKITARSYYRSNSQGVWRYLPDYEMGEGGMIEWYGKGHSEESITLPIVTQRALSEITHEGMPILQLKENPDFIFAGTAQKVDKKDGAYYREIEATPKKMSGDFYTDKGKTSPEQIELEEEQSPDFSKLLASWEQKTNIYGQFSVEVFPSKNGKLKFMFCKDSADRAWIGGIEDDSEVQSTGLKQTWVEGGDLTTPAYEYRTQTGGYGNDSMSAGSYVDMYENYLKKIPVIQEYVNTDKERRTDSLASLEKEKTSEDAIARAKAVLKETKDSLPNELSPKDKEDIERISGKVRSALGETEPASTPETENIPAETLEALGNAQTIEDVEKLDEAIKEKLGLKFNNLGFFVEENKNKFFANVLGKIASGSKPEGTFGRFVGSMAENYRRDQEKAKEKFEAVKQGNKSHLSNLGYLAGNILRYGRTILDFTSYTVASPFRYVTMSAMLASRSGEAAKEARLKNEKVIEKNRVNSLDIAETEAWKIYEEAQKKSVKDEDPTKEELSKAFLEQLPKDILNRFATMDPKEKPTWARFLVEGITKRNIESDLEKIQEKLDNAATETEKEQIIKKYEDKLKDYNRIISQYGEIDALAASAGFAHELGKQAAIALSIETLVTVPLEKIFDIKIWDSIAEILGKKSEIVEKLTPEQIEKTNEFFDNLAGVNSQDGIDNGEALKIAKLSETLKSSGHEAGADSLNSHFSQFLESSPEASAETPALENPAEAPATAPTSATTETIKPFRFENPIAGDQDSIWFSTEQSFRMNPDRFGYDATKDGSISEWAKNKTAETLKELADKKFNGKLPDLVHDGDKVVIEIGADGKPHVNFENASGIPAGNLPEKPSGLEIGKSGNMSPEQAWKNAPEDSRDAIVRQFIVKEMATPEYQAGDFPKPNPERIEVYAKMFSGEWNKIDTPEKLAQSLFEFNNRVKEYTALILEGKFDKNVDPVSFQQLKENIFPVEGKSGKLYFTQFVDEGKWKLFEEDAQGTTHQLDRKKGFLGGKTQVFDTMHVRKFLRSN